MSVYIGELETKINKDIIYFNFMPYHLYEDGKIGGLLNKENRREILPESHFGNINFYKQGDYFRRLYSNHEFVLFDFDIEDLDDNLNYSGDRLGTGYQANFDKINPDKLKRINDIGLYRLIEVNEYSGNYHDNPVLTINDAEDIAAYPGMKVVLELSGKDRTLLGPFTLGFRESDEKLFIRTDSQLNKKYVFPSLNFRKSYVESVKQLGKDGKKYAEINEHNCISQYYDIIGVETLLKNFIETINYGIYEDGRTDLLNPQDVVDAYIKSAFVGIPDDIIAGRVSALLGFLMDESKLSKSFEHIGEAMTSFILKYKEGDHFTGLLEILAGNTQFMGHVQRTEVFESKFKEQSDELNRISKQTEIMKAEYDSIVQNVKDEAQKQKEAILLENESELRAYQTEIDKCKKEIAVLEEDYDLKKELTVLHEWKNELSTLVKSKENEEEELNQRIGSLLNNAFAKAVELEFDSVLSDKVLRAAARRDENLLRKRYSAAVSVLKQLPPEALGKDELIDYLCARVGKYRPSYDKNSIINIFICMTQGFLTVFAGESGSGKTSICNIAAHVLGLTLPGERLTNKDEDINLNRYVSVSVERGWTSKRDFIGYYNPLTKQFDRSNRQVCDGLFIMDTEARGEATGLPYLILLDAANLSPMEYYWSDFMKVCDEPDNTGVINMGEDYLFRIPDFLRFTATITGDHTTEALSPGLIDRAWVIKLPAGKPVVTGLGESQTAAVSNPGFDGGIRCVSWASLVGAFAAKDDNEPVIRGTAKEIYDAIIVLLKKLKLKVSHRSDAAIRRYWTVAQSVFENEADGTIDASIVALDYAISQKIFPHITGSGERYGEVLKELEKYCANKNLHLSAEILGEIIRNGDENMFYYQYFA